MPPLAADPLAGDSALAGAWRRVVEELQHARGALAAGEAYLGMQGSTLTAYFLSLHANEGLLLQLLLRSQGGAIAAADYILGGASCPVVTAGIAPARSASFAALASGSLGAALGPESFGGALADAAGGAGAFAAAASCPGAPGKMSEDAAVEQALAEALTSHGAPHVAQALTSHGAPSHGAPQVAQALASHGAPQMAQAAPGTPAPATATAPTSIMSHGAPSRGAPQVAQALTAHGAPQMAQAAPGTPAPATATAPTSIEAPEVEETPAVVLSVPGRSMSGEYVVEVGLEHHGRPVFVRRTPSGSRPATYCYFWDATDGPSEWRGWWIGNEVGGNRVSAFAPAETTDPSSSPTTAGAGVSPGATSGVGVGGLTTDAAAGRPPVCPTIDHPMEWTCSAAYADYICNGCGGALRGERWHCTEHQNDFCAHCGRGSAAAGEKWPQAMARPPTDGWQVLGLSQVEREVCGEELRQ